MNKCRKKILVPFLLVKCSCETTHERWLAVSSSSSCLITHEFEKIQEGTDHPKNVEFDLAKTRDDCPQRWTKKNFCKIKWTRVFFPNKKPHIHTFLCWIDETPIFVFISSIKQSLHNCVSIIIGMYLVLVSTKKRVLLRPETNPWISLSFYIDSICKVNWSWGIQHSSRDPKKVVNWKDWRASRGNEWKSHSFHDSGWKPCPVLDHGNKNTWRFAILQTNFIFITLLIGLTACKHL